MKVAPISPETILNFLGAHDRSCRGAIECLAEPSNRAGSRIGAGLVQTQVDSFALFWLADNSAYW
ncbi:hypothetical protein I546_5175 [Mycobacterium kansasii 732]|nr:hypothetical protein I546_5175 [Mycobacterium kansasii 732]